MTPAQQIETNGFTLAPQLLTRAETDRLRAALLDHFPAGGKVVEFGRHQPGAAAAMPALSWLFSHPGILEIFRALLETDRPVFTGNADAHRNMFTHWHRDGGENYGGGLPGDPFSRAGCRLYRAGVYLQDHLGDGLGFNTRPGSHRSPHPETLPVRRLDTRLGDITFHDIRLYHAGVLPDRVERLLLGAGRRLGWPAWMVPVKNAWWWLSGKPQKLSIFFTFGRADADTEAYCRYELQARYQRLGADRFRLPEGLLQDLAAAGVLTYEAALAERFGPNVLDRFAETGVLPDERVWG